jgi:hypothetical protein
MSGSENKKRSNHSLATAMFFLVFLLSDPDITAKGCSESYPAATAQHLLSSFNNLARKWAGTDGSAKGARCYGVVG